ncbi:MAG TPA: MFS transporter [Jatrophihabitans sp.]|nr:MFS transporter [Jatrophihabitans sp.]
MRRWLILSLGLSAQAATCVFLYGLPMLVPQLREQLGLSLAQAGAVVGAPAIGLIVTLILWGALADRRGERLVIAAGLLLAALFLLAASRVHGVGALCLLLALAGAGGASVNAASGRVVLGWFAPHERGLAMGLRQTAQPLGVAIAALTLPALANRASVQAALLLPAALCVAVAVLVLLFVLDPVRAVTGGAVRSGSPYRVPTLWRLHATSTMLVVPQFAVSGFSMAYLVGQRHWSITAAAQVLFLAQLLGALGRIGAGLWSDRVASRMTPVRQLAVASALVMLGVSVGDRLHSPLVVPVLVLGAVITVADNGLAFTAVAEFAGSAWAGRALGAQNTAQNVASALTPPLLGALIGSHGYALGFAVGALFPLLAIALTPVRAERQAVTGPMVAGAVVAGAGETAGR